MKTLIKLLTVVLLAVGIAHADVVNKDAHFRNLAVHISSESSLAVGANSMLFSIKKGSQVLDDAHVRVKAFMPAMPGMPAMQYEVDATNIGNGSYKANINLAMSGTWQFHIFVTTKAGKKYRVKTSLGF